MKCPYCKHVDSSVVDSRDCDDLSSIRRRRECMSCHKRFTTYERSEMVEMIVVKKDGSRERFDKSKLLAGLFRATEKRPVESDRVTEIADDIERQLRSTDGIEVHSHLIGELVMEKLRSLDKIAYIRFASVYRDFQDIESFEKEVKSLRPKSKLMA